MKRIWAWMLVVSLLLELAIPAGITAEAEASGAWRQEHGGPTGVPLQTVSRKIGDLTAAVIPAVYEIPASPKGKEQGSTVSKAVYLLPEAPRLLPLPALTNLQTVEVAGTAALHAVVTVYASVGGHHREEIGQAEASVEDGPGVGRFRLTLPLTSEGEYRVTAAAEVNGQVSPESEPVQFTVDRTAPTPTWEVRWTNVGYNEIELQWDHPMMEDPSHPGTYIEDPTVDHYVVEKNRQVVAVTKDRYYFEGGLGEMEKIEYGVRSIDKAGNQSEEYNLWTSTFHKNALLVAKIPDQAEYREAYWQPTLSKDGKSVAYIAYDANPAPPRQSGYGIYVYDIPTGQTEWIAEMFDVQYRLESEQLIDISPDGRYVAYFENTDNGGNNVAVYDRVAKTKDRLPHEFGSMALSVSMSDDAQWLAFSSVADDVVSGDTNEYSDVFLYNRSSKELKRISVSAEGNQGNDASYKSFMSADGRYVLFVSLAGNLVTGTTQSMWRLYQYDTATGKLEYVPALREGGIELPVFDPSLSSDGRYIVFTSAYGTEDKRLYIMDRQTGRSEIVISFPRNEDIGIRDPKMSSDGRFISMEYYNYDPGSRPGPLGMFDSQWGALRYDRVNQEFQRLGNRAGSTYDTSLSGDGSRVAFTVGRNSVYVVCFAEEEQCDFSSGQEDRIMRPSWSLNQSVSGFPVMGGSFTVRAYSETGGRLEALVDYKAHAGSGAVAKQLVLPMPEAAGSPGLFLAQVQVPSDALELTGIKIRLTDEPEQFKQLTSLPVKIAGKLKVTIQTDYPNALSGTSVNVWSKSKQLGNRSSLSRQSNAWIAGIDLAEADDYEIKVVDSSGKILQIQEGIAVQGGREASVSVAVRPQAELHVNVRKDNNGASGEQVEFYDSQDRLLFSGRTDSNGDISLWGARFAGETIGIRVAARSPYAEPDRMSVRLEPGRNDQSFSLVKMTTGTLKGKVTDETGDPAANAKVELFAQEKGLWHETVTDESGVYQLSADVGSYLVTASSVRPFAQSIQSRVVQIIPGGASVADLTLYKQMTGTIAIDARMKPIDGDWQRIDIADWRTAVHYGLQIKSPRSSFYYNTDSVIGNKLSVGNSTEGDTLGVCINGREAGLSDHCDELVLDERLSGTAELRLEEKGRIRGVLVGESKLSDYRISVFSKGSGGSYGFSHYGSMDGNGSFAVSVPKSGDYRITISNIYGYYWNSPRSSYSIDVTVGEGELRDLGPVSIPPANALFQGKQGNGYNSQEARAMPGDTVTMRGSYRLADEAAVNDASIAVSVPAGTSLLNESVMLNGVLVMPIVKDGIATIPVGRIEKGIDGSISYRLKIEDQASPDIQAQMNIQYSRRSAVEPNVELLGTSFIRVGPITLEAPARFLKHTMKVGGRAPAGQTVTIYADGRIAGHAQATPGGLWYTDITLPVKEADAVWGDISRYRLLAKTENEEGMSQSQSVIVAIDPNQAVMTKFTMKQAGGRVIEFDPGEGIARFPFVIVPGMPMHLAAAFNDPERVSNVRVTIGEEELTAQWNESSKTYEAIFIPSNGVGTGVYITYDEKPKDYKPRPIPSTRDWEASLSGLPDIWSQAVYETVEEEELPPSKQASLADDGYYRSKPLKVTFPTKDKETLYVRWKMKPAPKPAGTSNKRIPYGDYSMDVNEAAGTVTIKATLPASLLSPQQQQELSAAFGAKGIEDHVINVLELVFKDSEAFGKFATGMDLKDYVMDSMDFAKYADDLIAFQDYVINSECHSPTVNHYIKMTDMLYEQAARTLIVKNTMTGLGLVAGTLTLAVPPVGGFVLATTFTVIGDIAKDSWEENLNQLKAEFEKDKQWRDDMAAAGAIDRCKKKDDDDEDEKKKRRKDDDKVADPTWIWDPSGYVYEAVPDNRVEGATATLLQLDPSSGQWHVWDSSWFGQQNPLITDSNGRYGWDVPEGKWKVLYEKEGYLPAESAELTVLPPHFDVNVPMTSLEAPKVSVIEAVYGSGVQVGFTKYMLNETVTGPFSIKVETAEGDGIAGTVVPVNPQMDGSGRPVAKRFRFIPDPADGKFKQGAAYKVTVAAQAFSYAHVAMEADQVADSIIVKAADAAPADAASGLVAAGGSKQIVVEWEKAQNADFKAYKLYWQSKSGTSSGSEEISAGQSFAVLRGLQHSMTYDLKLVTVGYNGMESPGLRTSAATIKEEELVMDTIGPGQPAGIAIVADKSALTLNWADPADIDLRKMLVSWKQEGDARFGNPEYVNKGTQTWTVNGLKPGTDYIVRLVAADTYWNESAAAEIKGRTLNYEGPDETPPGNVTSTAASGASGTIHVSWKDPADTDLDHILISWKKEGASGTFTNPVIVAKGTQAYDMTGLPSNTLYEIRLVAVDTSGNAAPGVSVSARTFASSRSRSGGGVGGIVPPADPNGSAEAVTVPVFPEAQTWSGFGGTVSLNIPSGAFDEAGQLTIRRLKEDEVAIPAAFNRYSEAFQLQLDRGSMAKPVNLTLKYEAAQRLDFDARKLGLFRRDEANLTQWHYAGGVYDSGSSTVTAKIDSAGIYAIMDYNRSFADLNGHWSKRDMEVLISRRIVDGMTESEFQPDRPITRAQFTKLLVEMTKWPSHAEVSPAAATASTAASSSASSAVEEPFRDVPNNAWYYPYIAEAKKRGLVQGDAAGAFRPDESLTREELAVLIVRALGLEGQAADKAKQLEAADAVPGFTDGSAIAAWAAGYVELAREQALIDGVGEDVFAPQATASRAQGGVLVLRAMSKLGQIGH
ncbi:S-layer homology domain-containing protein [Paenibacillus sp. NPDC056579]|uniref:S-layer homology domain-containing protein n=1 Tax=Paenibacillus sp. NPDC056579 TaxID=3345871 RepID=UPI003676BB59